VGPLVGRRDEVAYLHSSILSGRGVMVAGSAGVGKSRLASTVADELAARGWTVHRCAATPELARIPFAVFASLPGNAGGDLLDRFAAVATALGKDDQTLVLVDDAHDLDEASVAFVHHLVAATSVRLLLTARTGATVAGSIAALVRRGPLERVELQPLSPGEVRELLDALVDGADDGVADRLWRRTHGNPLFVHELLLDAADSGDVRELRPGERVQEVVAGRLADLDPAERAVVEVLALAEPLGLRPLERIVGHGAIESLERRALVRWHADGRRQELRLVHPVYGDAVRADLGAAAVRRHRLALIDALAAEPCRRRDDRLRLATWRADAGQVGDVDALVAAAHELLHSMNRGFADHLAGRAAGIEVPSGFLAGAERLARTAFDHGGGFPAAMALLQALQHQGKRDDITRFFDELDHDLDSPGRIVESTVLAAMCHIGVGDPGRAADLYAERAELVPLGLRERLLVGRVQSLLLAGRLPDAVEALAPLDDLVPPFARDRLVLAAHRGMVLGMQGRGDDALAVIDAAIAAADGTEDAGAFAEVFLSRTMALHRTGRAREAVALGDAALAVASSAGEDEQAVQAHLLYAGLAIAVGRIDSARRHALVTVAAEARFGDPISLRHLALLLASQAASMLGRCDDARELAVAAEAAPVHGRDIAPGLDRTRAWLAACTGRHAAAVELLVDVAGRYRVDGNAFDELTTLQELVRMGEVGLAIDRIREMAPTFQGPLGRVVLDHAEGLVTKDGRRLDGAAEAASDVGLVLVAAEISAQAAQVHEDAGLQSSAAASRRRAAEWQAMCEGAVTPALRANVAPGLTKREREVADLAATGLSDQQIADDLVLSVRTIEKHLANAYAKLGVTSRRELTALLSSPPS
jgi:DNA-binding CsgD family transcriptional regulator